MAYAASVVENPRTKSVNRDELKQTSQAIEKVHAICNVSKGSTELVADLGTLYQCIW